MEKSVPRIPFGLRDRHPYMALATAVCVRGVADAGLRNIHSTEIARAQSVDLDSVEWWAQRSIFSPLKIKRAIRRTSS